MSWNRNSSGHVIGAKSARSVWRTSFDPKLIPPPTASLTETVVNPADHQTMNYELGLIKMFHNMSMTFREEGHGFDLLFSTSRR